MDATRSEMMMQYDFAVRPELAVDFLLREKVAS